MKNNLQLVNFQTPDSLTLPGLLYEPEKKTDKVLIYLHGNGSASIFYSPETMKLCGEYLNKIGVAFFPFNNRGAHWIKKLKKKVGDKEEGIPYGMTYELINECIYDIDGAVDFLRDIGYKTFYLAGVSTGANKIVVYNYYKSQAKEKNLISKYILISGGDDVSVYLNFYFKSDKKIFAEMLNKCKEEIQKGQGRSFVPQNIIADPLISYQSLYDTINPDGNYNIFPFDDYLHNLRLGNKRLFKEFKTLEKQTLMIYGGSDEYSPALVSDCVNVLKKECSHPGLFTFKIINGADHGFTGKEKELVEIISKWL
ncbi:hypothetical protein A2767_05640 [Candidatus Roizmanbacteria bacterium RIFCSPHIGHO2_01_FULL_35_10]|uniref:Uncharacterized protein n=1 Tax=Candidatus Roizmanbacteria bacterium RIFCSPLOWO2_01_FULL_35_13 TaxID=1802055 RepID=A0A1F7IBP4_9BACT|nr:MAG: hypothetical protein A2767_05640 [Candidatus Roizmanbacteria bacterium RIFCSPHIGHO2_01_FULL_35_10]OGK40775.1 MAG: hypothetical protein A3A74_04110 [Candidatus Roizmanbacteria bacterium RIFCSPLOWO2_01_FULL_35_13]